MVYYFVTELATKYKGKAKYEKYSVPKGLDKTSVKELFLRLAKKRPDLLGLFYNPEKGEMIIWYAKTHQFIAPIVAGLLGVIGGGILFARLTRSGEGDWNINNPPGLGFSIWDLIKLGLLSFIVYMFAKTFTDVLISVRKQEPMPTPYEVFVKPAEPAIGRAVQAVRQVTPQVIRGITTAAAYLRR